MNSIYIRAAPNEGQYTHFFTLERTDKTDSFKKQHPVWLKYMA